MLNLLTPTQFYSPHASLAALGLKLQRLGVFKTLDKHLKIKQKVLKYHPTTKLYSVLVAILAGMQSMVELNKVLRADLALQKAFGLSGCAEQSTIQDTLDKCDQANLAQMQAAVNEIYQGLAKAPNHNFVQGLLLVDSDFTPSPAGLLAEKGSKGYFGKLHHHFGRQIGRVIATQYQEIVVEQLYGGNVQLNVQFQALVLEAEKRLHLDEAKRNRTVLRADSNAGSIERRWVEVIITMVKLTVVAGPG